jgi:hypothetical protein
VRSGTERQLSAPFFDQAQETATPQSEASQFMPQQLFLPVHIPLDDRHALPSKLSDLGALEFAQAATQLYLFELALGHSTPQSFEPIRNR